MPTSSELPAVQPTLYQTFEGETPIPSNYTPTPEKNALREREAVLGYGETATLNANEANAYTGDGGSDYEMLRVQLASEAGSETPMFRIHADPSGGVLLERNHYTGDVENPRTRQTYSGTEYVKDGKLTAVGGDTQEGKDIAYGLGVDDENIRAEGKMHVTVISENGVITITNHSQTSKALVKSRNDLGGTYPREAEKAPATSTEAVTAGGTMIMDRARDDNGDPLVVLRTEPQSAEGDVNVTVRPKRPMQPIDESRAPAEPSQPATRRGFFRRRRQQ